MYDIDKLNLYWTKDIQNRIFSPEKIKKVGLDNQLLNLEKTILLHPNNVHHLLMPLTNDIFVETLYKKFFVKLGLIEGENDTFLSILNPLTNAKKAVIFVQGKFAVGIGALSITFAAINQVNSVAGNSINNSYFAGTDSEGNPIFKPSAVRFKSANQYDFSSYTDSQLNTLSEVMSQLLTMYVDGVKEPYAVLMNITLQTANVVDYLIKNNVSAGEITKFLSQPIIKTYLSMQKVNESMYLKNDTYEELVPVRDKEGRPVIIEATGDVKTRKVTVTREVSKKELIAKVLETIGQQSLQDPQERVGFMTLTNFEITEQQLTTDLFDPNTTEDYRERQAYYLQSFLELQELSKMYGDFLKTQNSDTKGWADSQDWLADKQLRNDVGERNLVPDDIVEFHDNQGLISPFYKNGRTLYRSLYEPFYGFIEGKTYSDYINDLKVTYAKSQKGSSKERLMSTIDNDFILFLIHNFYFKESDFNRLMTGENSVAKRIRQAKIDLPSNVFLKSLQPLIGEKNKAGTRVDNIRLYEKKLDGYSANDIVKAFEELYEIDSQLYTDIIQALYFQNGFNQGILNFFNIVPQGKNETRTEDNAHLYLTQDISEQAFKQFNDLNEEQKNIYLEKFTLLFDLNNPNFLGSRFNGHRVRAKRITDLDGRKSTVYVLDKKDSNGKEIIVPLLGGRNLKRYNVSGLVTKVPKSDKDLLNDAFLPNTGEQTTQVEDPIFNLGFTNARQYVQYIADSSDAMAPLANRLLRFKTNVPVIITENVLPDDVKGTLIQNYGPSLGAYFPSTREIKISPKTTYPTRTILHEQIHAITHQYIRDNPNSKEVQDLNALLDYTRSKAMSIPANAIYPLENLDEFITGIFTRGNFMLALTQIPYKGSNVLTELINWFAKIFQLTPKQTTLFEEVMYKAEMLLDQIEKEESLGIDLFESIQRQSDLETEYQKILDKYGVKYKGSKEINKNAEWGKLLSDIAKANKTFGKKLNLYRAPNEKWYLRIANDIDTMSVQQQDNRVIAEANSEQMNTNLGTLGQEVFEKWDNYFEDYSHISEEDKQAYAQLVDSGQVQIQCKL